MLGLGLMSPNLEAAQDLELGERLRAHIEFLADDALRGRQPGTEGYAIAARYVANQYRQLGLDPASGGSYFQHVPLRQAWLVEGSARLEVLTHGNEQALTFLEDFFQAPSLSHIDSEIETEMVFVGYGIHALPLGHDDYAGLDLHGKVAVMVAGKPIEFPSEEGSHFGATREKVRAALAHGAVAVITIYTPRTQAVFPWDRLSSQLGVSSMGWLDNDGLVPDSPAALKGDVLLHHRSAAVLFEGSDIVLEQVIEADQNGLALPRAALVNRVRLSQQSRHEPLTSPNVVGVLPGSDPLLADEYVIYTAHLDHLGELPGTDSEDRIHNGALDNAAGVAVMLETARMLGQGQRPKRSVMFLAVTAEEKGLVGSGYFAHHPTVPAGQMAAVVNLDMPVLLYEFGDMIAFGAEHSSLGKVAARAAAQAGVVLTPDPYPDRSVFVRSDHYRFVQQGVPALFLVTGPDTLDSEISPPPLMEQFMSEHYHMPSDDLRLPINYSAAARFTRINTHIGAVIANDPQRPRWNEGSFFGETFGKVP